MPNYKAYRRATADQVHPYLLVTATVGSTENFLEVDKWPIKSTIEQSDLFSDYFMLRPDAADENDKHRTCDIYTPTLGRLLPDKPWTNSPWDLVKAKGEEVELHGVVDPAEFLQLVNDALLDLMIVVEFSLPAKPDVVEHVLNEYETWLTEPKWVRNVGWLSQSDDRKLYNPFRQLVMGDLKKRSDEVLLAHDGRTFSSGDRLYVECLKPAYYHCRAVGGTYGDQTGLALDTDEAVPQADWLAAKCRAIAWDRWKMMLGAGDKERAAEERRTAADLFSEKSSEYLDIPNQETRPVRPWGPRR